MLINFKTVNALRTLAVLIKCYLALKALKTTIFTQQTLNSHIYESTFQLRMNFHWKSFSWYEIFSKSKNLSSFLLTCRVAVREIFCNGAQELFGEMRKCELHVCTLCTSSLIDKAINIDIVACIEREELCFFNLLTNEHHWK